MVNIILKTIVIYVLIIFSMRLMGKKLAGQMQPYELVIMLLIAEVAATPMDSPGTPLSYGLVPAVTLLLLYYALDFLCLKNKKLRNMLCGKPSIVIHNGMLQMKEIRKVGYSLNDLVAQLRISGNTNIGEIHYAVLETNGQLSVIPYERFSPVTPDAMDLEVEEENFCSALILDGKFHDSGMQRFGFTATQMKKTLHTLGFPSIKEIFIFTLSDTGEVFIQDKKGNVRQRVIPLGAWK